MLAMNVEVVGQMPRCLSVLIAIAGVTWSKACVRSSVAVQRFCDVSIMAFAAILAVMCLRAP